MTKNNKSPQKPTHKQSKPTSQVYSINQKVYIIPLKINGIVKEYDLSKNLYLITYFIKNNKNNVDNKNKKDKRLTKWFTFDQISDNVKIKPITEEGRKTVGEFIQKHKVEVHQDYILPKSDVQKLREITKNDPTTMKISDNIKEHLKKQRLLQLENDLNELPINKGGMLDTYNTFKIGVNQLTKDAINDLKEQIEHYKTLYLEYKNLYENQKTVNYLNNKKETK